MNTTTLSPKHGRLLPPKEPGGPVSYAVDHLVTFGETSMAGFVYYIRLVEWQGRLRETFAFDLVPEYMHMLADGRLVMLTQSVSCEYFSEIKLGELISQRLAISWIDGARMLGDYAYYRTTPDSEELVAQGQQMWVNATPRGTAAPWPASVLDVCRRLDVDTSQALTT
ncbi:acyl-CoA thioesterase [Streptomyces massasporeus]|uniref:acyl-CoA thioesterase n=1 Tax=Streptomyces massasporeus TaxID=67324 RepID=UPI0036859CB9